MICSQNKEKKETPCISVITIVRNDVNNVEKTIISVLSQTYKHLEYIIIDGDSDDGTIEVINKYSDKINRIISEPDKGIYDGMNKGIRYASGEWILFMNSGDTFYSKTVVDDVFSNYEDKCESIIYGMTNLINPCTKQNEIRVRQAKEEMPGVHQSIFTRAQELKKHPFDISYRIIADFAFYYELYGRSNKYLFVDLVISNYDLGGISSTARIKTLKEFLRLYSSHKDIRFFKTMLYLIIENVKGIWKQ